jgi:hypothetical protein
VSLRGEQSPPLTGRGEAAEAAVEGHHPRTRLEAPIEVTDYLKGEGWGSAGAHRKPIADTTRPRRNPFAADFEDYGPEFLDMDFEDLGREFPGRWAAPHWEVSLPGLGRIPAMSLAWDGDWDLEWFGGAIGGGQARGCGWKINPHSRFALYPSNCTEVMG